MQPVAMIAASASLAFRRRERKVRILRALVIRRTDRVWDTRFTVVSLRHAQ
jgi:hypothetical protein